MESTYFYHLSPNKFDKFDTKHNAGVGHYFAKNLEDLKGVARAGDDYIYVVSLDIKNPVSSKEYLELLNKAGGGNPRRDVVMKLKEKVIDNKKEQIVTNTKFYQEVRKIIREQIEFLLERKSEFEKLKDNKIPLTDDEREKVMKADAVWNFSPGNKPSPAVWKSKDKKGKITYVTHTHRAYNTASTLKGAIGRYHKFIKGTA